VVDEGSTSLRVRQTLTVFSQGGALFVYGYRSRHVLVAARILAELSEWNVRGFIKSGIAAKCEANLAACRLDGLVCLHVWEESS